MNALRAFVLSILVATGAQAASVTFNFTGVIDAFNPVFFPSPGSVFSGSYTFETGIADINSTTPFSGRYPYDPDQISMQLVVGGVLYDVDVASSPQPAAIQVGHFPLPPSDPNTPTYFYAVSAGNAAFALTGNETSPFSSDVLPLVPPDLTAFNLLNRFIVVQQGVPAPESTILDGHLTSLTLASTQAVPEPGSLLLLGTGLVGLVGLARRRKS